MVWVSECDEGHQSPHPQYRGQYRSMSHPSLKLFITNSSTIVLSDCNLLESPCRDQINHMLALNLNSNCSDFFNIKR